MLPARASGMLGINGFHYVRTCFLTIVPPISRFIPLPLKVSNDLLRIDFLKQYLNSPCSFATS